MIEVFVVVAPIVAEIAKLRMFIRLRCKLTKLSHCTLEVDTSLLVLSADFLLQISHLSVSQSQLLTYKYVVLFLYMLISIMLEQAQSTLCGQ